MKTIRRSTFETNSSSTHSITMCMKSDYDKFCKGELFVFDGYGFDIPMNKKFYTKEEAVELYKNHYKYKNESLDWSDEMSVREELDEAGFHDSNYENEYLECYFETFTTPNGEEVVAFGEYGYNG